MKIRCNACEAAEARVLCCADEAALCGACDEKVHAANKLAGKHQRVPLLDGGGSSPPVPVCDICQEASGYFFCLEDRALLCRNCDVAVHTANPYVSAHQRFLLTGIQVGLEPAKPVVPIAEEQLNAPLGSVESPSKVLPRKSRPMSLSGESSAAFSSKVGMNGEIANKISFSASAMSNQMEWPIGNQQFNFTDRSVETASRLLSKRSPSILLPGESDTSFSSQAGRDERLLFTGASMSVLPDWPMDEFFGFTEFNHSSVFSEHGSPKADSGKHGSSEGSPFCLLDDGDLEPDEYLGQVPDMSRTVPEIPSPPTASGLHWLRNLHYPALENAAFVPDVCSSHSPRKYLRKPAGTKRSRRH